VVFGGRYGQLGIAGRNRTCPHNITS
jgi:hypothetical protein